MIDYNHYIQTAPGQEEHESWRRQMLALLAGERANLLFLLLGLDEETLTGQPVFEKHTAKDILAHIASWDELHRERMALALEGREEVGPTVGLDERNARLQERHQLWSLEQALAAFTGARDSFLETVSHVPDETLHKPVQLPGSQVLLRTLVMWRARHDARHATDIREWRERLDLPFVAGPPALLLEALRASRSEIVALAHLLPPEQQDRYEVTSGWTFQDVIGHLADWDLFLLEGLQAGQLEDYGGDLDQWNEVRAGARRSQPWPELWQEYQNGRQKLLDVVAAMDQTALDRILPNPWSESVSAYRNVVWWLEHERDHAGQLREALGVTGGEEAAARE